MLLAVCEGRHWRYEVCEHADGYLVQMRDLETGDPMPVAFAYAEMSAAYDIYAAADAEAGPDEEIDLEIRQQKFITLSDRLGDSGLNGGNLKAWERATGSGTRRVYH
jgi:hypothetical protein